MEPKYRLVRYRGKYAVYWRDDRGRPRRSSLGTSDGESAKRGLSEFIRLTDLRRSSGNHTIASLWDLRRKALGARRLAENMAYSGVPVLPAMGFLEPHSLSKQHILDYVASRTGEGKAPGTIWTELNHLRMTLAWAKKEGLIKEYQTFSLPPRPPSKTDYLTKEQVRELTSRSEFPHLSLFILFAVATGARNRAILDCTWDRVDFTRRLIDLRVPGDEHRKNRALVPINNSLMAALETAYPLRDSDYVISWAGHRVFSVKKALKRLATLCGIPSVSPHMFRHSAAVWMAEAGTPMEEISQYLGHTDISVTRKTYARFSPDYLRKAASALEL